MIAYIEFKMLLNLGVAATLSCGTPTIQNDTDHPWNKIDQRNYESAMVRCGEKFENSPCLKQFIKRDVQVYWAICGRKND